MDAPILVTGATGTVGGRVAAALRRDGRAVRIVSRHPADDGVVRFDFRQPSTYAAAFAGVRTAFLVRPPDLARLDLITPALKAAVEAGVRHVVLLSVQGAERLPFLPHARIERWLRASPLSWTFLRPSFFDQNLTGAFGRGVRERSELIVPAGRGRVAFVDAEDVAQVAALVLADPAAHAGRAWTLTGAEALTYGEVAGIMTAVLGRPVRYRQQGLLRYLVRARRDLRLPVPLVVATAVICTTARLGLAAGLTDDTARLLGRAPTPMAEWVRREREALSPRR